MKVAIVGFGTAGEARLSAYRPIPGADVVAVVEPSPERRERVRALDRGVRTYASLGELFAATPVDAVDVCTPPAYHARLARAALLAGRHVICEKPVALSTAQALDLVRHARRGRALLYPAHNYGFSPMMRALTGAVAAGRVGGPMSATFAIERDTHARGVSGWQPDWRRDRALAGGGILMDHGTHCVYMATRLFGAVPQKVSGVARWAGDDPAGGVDEAMDVHLDFPVGDCTISLSWVGSRRTNLYALSGPAGAVEVRDGIAELTGPGGTERRNLVSPTADSTHRDWFADMFADFAGLVSSGTGWDRPLTEAVTTTAVVCAAYRSALRGGEPVGVEYDETDDIRAGAPAGIRAGVGAGTG